MSMASGANDETDDEVDDIDDLTDEELGERIDAEADDDIDDEEEAGDPGLADLTRTQLEAAARESYEFSQALEASQAEVVTLKGTVSDLQARLAKYEGADTPMKRTVDADFDATGRTNAWKL